MEQALIYAGQSVPGRVRGHNEDALLCCPQLNLWAIADGMGGHQCGEVASALALQTLQAACAEGQDLVTAVHAANREILSVARTGEQRGMGTTLVAVHFAGAAFRTGKTANPAVFGRADAAGATTVLLSGVRFTPDGLVADFLLFRLCFIANR
mgnify:CR=1 FL=1